ncbi:MAG: DUF541 domain-containing protein [Chloroflexi bacterium]|nr:MAG: DUF541 domain-containing protein [Chloroflexota bacterium]
MRNKTFPIILIVVLSLLAAACSPQAMAQVPEQTSPLRTVSVTGSAEVMLEPDVAYISIGVHTEGEDAGQAVDENNAQVQQVIDALVAQGVDEDDIQTVNFSIYPMTQYGANNEVLGVRYAVDNSVYVTLRDIENIGDLLGAATEVGANSINGISFDVLDKEAALVQARTEAIANARTTAEQLAEAAGVTLGEVHSINYSGTGFPGPIVYGRGGGMAAMDSAVPISTGQIRLTADVNVVFEIQ